MAGKHTLTNLTDEQLRLCQRAIMSHSAVINRTADLLLETIGDATVFRREANRLSTLSMLVQLHTRSGCGCLGSNPEEEE